MHERMHNFFMYIIVLFSWAVNKVLLFSLNKKNTLILQIYTPHLLCCVEYKFNNRLRNIIQNKKYDYVYRSK